MCMFMIMELVGWQEECLSLSLSFFALDCGVLFYIVGPRLLFFLFPTLSPLDDGL